MGGFFTDIALYVQANIVFGIAFRKAVDTMLGHDFKLFADKFLQVALLLLRALFQDTLYALFFYCRRQFLVLSIRVRTLARRLRECVNLRKTRLFYDTERIRKIPVRFRGETDDNVRRDGGIWKRLVNHLAFL